SDDIILIPTSGPLVRTRVSEIRVMGRATQGVTLITGDDDSAFTGVRRVAARDAELNDAATAPPPQSRSDEGQAGTSGDTPDSDDPEDNAGAGDTQENS